MFYLYNTSTGDVLRSSPERDEISGYVQSGLDILEYESEVLGSLSELQVVGSAVTSSHDAGLALAADVREERDRLIAETDWWASSDRTMTSAQARYRQDLRDITAQAGFPTNVTWPTKP